MLTFPFTFFKPEAIGGDLTITLLDNVKADASATTIVSNSVSPSAGAHIFVIASNNGRRTIFSVASVFSSGTWTDPGWGVVLNSNKDPAVGMWHASFTSGSGAITVTYNIACIDRQLSVYEITGHNTTTPFPQGLNGTDSLLATTAVSLTLGSAPAAGSIAFGAICNSDNASASANIITPGSGFTEIYEDFNGSATGCWQQCEYDDTSPGTTVDWSTLKRWKAFLAFEIQAA